MKTDIYVVTISHQLGSGGAYLGEKLSVELGIPFLDKAILREVAKQLNLAEAELKDREERLSSFWENFTRMAAFSDPMSSLAIPQYLPSDNELFEMECNTINLIAAKRSAIFLGRCGRFVLKDHPRRFSLLVTAEKPERIKRLRDLYKITEEEAWKLIVTNDQERSDYIHNFTKQNWLDASNYDLCINTSSLGLDSALELTVKSIHKKLILPPV